ncbi:MAG: SET domain-containing protein-lysine N-methyltransferase [Pyrinomonadaceae bacterium]|nr:SET domain-containing protein-lysine N-methyltransferase [Pyrinomonadaceae bacterium]
MKNTGIFENTIIYQPELTAFVREVVLPGSSNVQPKIDSRFCRFNLKYAHSPIHRWGIFAAEKIPARRRVIEYTGQKIDASEVRRRRFRHHLYIFQLTQNRAVDGAIGGSGAEFINHSCQPNLMTRIVGGRIFFVSNRQIESGEELTLDYNIVMNGTNLPCSCGTEKCRGIINQNKQR